ncbi:alpha/beta fold hydrolase [Streptomyces sp. H39-S7]|uniref:alpha/beta fold hydrolase n=1 Tax=Streptomyces sp. H39-S7 TaxID=3004357 RepID=UPI0022B02157|nr:alpha/beta hydrolase [Streptomyces sp. H39-S7]MCZ4123127.1 alpha/beta hydrolase [Streptomyces sp. H39-S7]
MSATALTAGLRAGPVDTVHPLLVRQRPATGEPHLRGLLLHGLASGSSVWDSVWPNAPGGVEAWVADLPWRGDYVSAWGRQYQETDWMASCLDAVPGGVDVVIAHSFSANLLMEFLSRQAARGADPYAEYGIKGIVLVSPFYRRNADDFAWDAIAGMQQDFLKITEEGIRLRPGRPIDPDIQRRMARRVCERAGPYGWMRFFEVYLRTPWLRTDLIPVPVLVVTGQQDFAARESETLAADLPQGALRVIPECGHYPMAEHAERFSAELDRFFATFLPTPRSA